jgi:hypothetical protein
VLVSSRLSIIIINNLGKTVGRNTDQNLVQKSELGVIIEDFDDLHLI